MPTPLPRLLRLPVSVPVPGALTLGLGQSPFPEAGRARPCSEWMRPPALLPAGTACVILSEHHLSSHRFHTPSSSSCWPPHHTEPLCVTLNPGLGSSRQLGLRLRVLSPHTQCVSVPTLRFSSSIRGAGCCPSVAEWAAPWVFGDGGGEEGLGVGNLDETGAGQRVS